MQKISEIFIKSFRCLNCFSLDINKKETTKTFNLNLLIGKNGAGKSTFLDALFEIATNANNPDKIFQHYLKDDEGNLICGNCSPINHEKVEEKQNPNLWKKVIRFYTGNSERNIEYDDNYTENHLSFKRENVKFVLSALFLSGAWNNPENKEIIDKFKKIIFDEDATFEPIRVWVDIANYNKESFEIKNDKFIEKVVNGTQRLYLNISDVLEIVSSFSVLDTLLKGANAEVDDENIIKTPNTIVDTGFLYKKLNTNNSQNKDLYIDETLSDGELSFIRRFALIMIMKELNEKENRSLLLLDEPETHFNENWKRHFIYLVEEALRGTCHDIFIATHSAMLITDVKRDELYKFELVNDKIKTYPVNLNTFGANIIDIGQALFDLESDIGERSKNEIQSAIDTNNATTLKDLLKQVGPGEWRWKIRAKLNQLEKHKDEYCHYLKEKNRDLENHE